MSSADGLAEALAAEYAAIFGYGVVGAHLDKAGQDAARQAEAQHRARRDELILRIAASMTPPPGSPAYNLPFAVDDRDSALRLAVALEEGAAQAWRYAMALTSGDDRRLAVNSLIACAIAATRWKRTAGISPVVVVFPGMPA